MFQKIGQNIDKHFASWAMGPYPIQNSAKYPPGHEPCYQLTPFLPYPPALVGLQ